jgi:hypothetical protein
MRYGPAICAARAAANAMRPGLQFARAMCGLTFEFSRGQRHCAWAVWRMINSGAARPRRNADDRRLQRGVRPQQSQHSLELTLIIANSERCYAHEFKKRRLQRHH